MKKVVIGMSGGVDSSVAAILLKNQGYEVIGLFMRNWDASLNNDFLGNPTLNQNICPQEQDYNDALKVCKQIGIPLHRIDFVKEYWDYVFTYFLEELKLGRTPNPDIMCNKYIKFDMFVKEAKKLEADYIATGHYARIENGKLLKAVDHNKDQTYFLSQLSKKQLSHVLFPIGNLDKPEVRKLASEYNLVTAKKKDSTGICFIGERNFTKFLENYLPNIPGKIINIETNEVIGAIIDTINWIGDTKPNKCCAKFRYRQQDNPVNMEYIDDNHILVTYSQGIKAVTPGQACVFYKDDECLGGGLIKEVRKNGEKLWYL